MNPECLVVSSYSEKAQRSFVDMFRIRLDWTKQGLPNFQVLTMATTLYEGYNITSLTLTQEGLLFISDKGKDTISKANVKGCGYEYQRYGYQPIPLSPVEPLFSNIKNLDSVGHFNHELYWVIDDVTSNKTLDFGSLFGVFN
jgi:hypothetical protein